MLGWRPRLVAASGLGVALLALPAHPASFPPELRFRTLVTERVTLHFHQGLEPQARRAAALAGEALAALETRYGTRVGRVQVVLSDVDDQPNGFATPLPYPLVSVRAAAPDGTGTLGNLEDWLRLVLTHELAHVVHLDQARGLPRFGRRLFGRAPFLFPNLLTPGWMIEGLATHEETRATAFGRGRSAQAEMVRRMQSLEGPRLGEDQAVLGLDRWPAGQGSYLFGQAFLADLERQHGPRTLPDLARVHAARPVPFLDDLTAKSVTGGSFHRRWREWSAREEQRFAREADQRRAAGWTPTRALTTRGVRQYGPRFSPDGGGLAYTSTTHTRLRQIRWHDLASGRERVLAERVAGDTLSFTPDGRALVYDEPETEGLFRVQGGLRRVELAGGRPRWIARGLRASAPDVAPEGARLVFVRRHAERSELALIGLDGSGLVDLTRSPAGTEWSAPRYTPDGSTILATRFSPGGWTDLVAVRVSDGTLRELTHDRAVDAEPCPTPDGRWVVFRSERDGVPELYALPLDPAMPEGERPVRLTRVLGGAFAPAVSPDGRWLALAAYSARGFDVHWMDLDLDGLAAAEPFVDPFPAPRRAPQPVDVPDRPYRPWDTLWPRFWSPYVASESGETRLGAFSGGVDALFRHAWGVLARRGFDSRRTSVSGFYQYDGWRPTLLLYGEQEHDPPGRLGAPRTRTLQARATWPLARSQRAAQDLSLAWRAQSVRAVDSAGRVRRGDQGGLELAWALFSARRHAYSISPVDGWRLRLAALREERWLGSDEPLTKLTADARWYLRLGEEGVLALRGGGGTTRGGDPRRPVFAVGGFPDGVLFDRVLVNPALLRGYPDLAATGRALAYANVEWRRALGHPQRGWRTLPLFVRHLHGALYADAAHAWSGALRLSQARVGVGAAVGADVFVGHALPLSANLGLARGLVREGETRVYFHLGLAF